MEFQRDERVEGRRRRRRQIRRRRAVGVLLIAGVATLVAVGAQSIVGGERREASAQGEARLAELPLGGRTIFPAYRLVVYYGAPGDDNLGALGIGSPSAAGERLQDQAYDYEGYDRPIHLAFELIATLVTSSPGEDGMHRTRISDETIQRYLESARQHKALLILDVQPGRADFMAEVRHYRRWLEEPDVGLALDPEWSMGPGEVPGSVFGSTTASKVNEVSAYVSQIVKEKRLPQKVLIVHQFVPGMIRSKSRVQQRDDVAVVINIDGFGSPEEKVSKYNEFTRGAQHFNGFKLFYDEDTRKGNRLMTPQEVMELDPLPDVVVYE